MNRIVLLADRVAVPAMVLVGGSHLLFLASLPVVMLLALAGP